MLFLPCCNADHLILSALKGVESLYAVALRLTRVRAAI